jgi:hypothetical protein
MNFGRDETVVKAQYEARIILDLPVKQIFVCSSEL